MPSRRDSFKVCNRISMFEVGHQAFSSLIQPFLPVPSLEAPANFLTPLVTKSVLRKITASRFISLRMHWHCRAAYAKIFGATCRDIWQKHLIWFIFAAMPCCLFQEWVPLISQTPTVQQHISRLLFMWTLNNNKAYRVTKMESGHALGSMRQISLFIKAEADYWECGTLSLDLILALQERSWWLRPI